METQGYSSLNLTNKCGLFKFWKSSINLAKLSNTDFSKEDYMTLKRFQGCFFFQVQNQFLDFPRLLTALRKLSVTLEAAY